MPRDYYEVLGVSRDADAKEIKRAYRKLAMKYHPDRSKEAGDADRFKEVSEAYAVLSDEEKRRVYDAYGHAGLEGRYGSADQWFQEADFSSVFRDLGLDLGGIFEQFFGGGVGGFGSARSRRAARGEDLVTRVTVSPREVLEGGDHEVSVERLDPCAGCGGSGAGPDGRRERCSTCGGAGQVGRTQRTPFGVFTQVGVCEACGGEGERVTHPCRTCNGKGVARQRKTIRVQVPAGVDDGMRLRLRGQGHAHPRGARGDAYVLVQVGLPPGLERRGQNLVTQLKVPAPVAVLGSRARVEGIDEDPVEVDIPPGTQPGEVVRKKGHGVPPVGGGARGDLFVEVVVEVPKKLSKEEREHWEALFGHSGADDRKDLFSRIGDKVRETFG